jgi:hypothetical protein
MAGAISNIDPKTISTVVTNPNAVAIFGENTGIGASGSIAGPDAIFKSQVGVFGRSFSAGVFGFSDKFGSDGTGVAGNTNAGTGTGVHGHTSTGVGVLGTCDNPAGLAGRFDGKVLVNGDITAHDLFVHDVSISGGDCAEDFEVADDPNLAPPGTVMVLDEQGALRPSCGAYDRKVAGVLSGAGDFRPGIVLNKRQAPGRRLPLALVGRVFCRVDAQSAPIEVGDLLTTSSVPGHAMKAGDPLRAFGAVIGKALRPLAEGSGLIPILIALQ